jgi:protein-disulfide isomerase
MSNCLRALVIAGVAVALGCSTPAAQSSQDVQTLRKELEELRAAQTAMAKDLAEVRDFLRAATGGRFGSPPIEGASFDIAGQPVYGQPTAALTLVEISDYHCPFCRRHVQQTQPQIYSEYVATGKVRHVFIHYPIEQLHPDAYKSHEAAACAADQGKFWPYHAKLFEQPVRSTEELTQAAQAAGLDAAALRACIEGGTHRESVRQSVARIQQMGISGTPMFLLGRTPAPGQPMTVVKAIEGAQPFTVFKAAFDEALK